MRKRAEVSEGDRYGHWVVIREIEHKKGEKRKLLCRCDCGNEKIVQFHHVINGNSKSCGCNSWIVKRINADDYIGKKYGKLVIVGKEPVEKYKHIKVRCKCDCGREKSINFEDVVYGHTKSCGCNRYTHNKVEHKCRERLYRIRQLMIQRCNNPKVPNYHNYGGRGITVCKEWENDYFAFRNWALENGYEETLTLDRIDNDGNYEPSNCRWVSMKVQSNNKRDNLRITYQGETHTVQEWSEITGIRAGNIYERYYKGFVLDVVFSQKRLSPRGHYEKRTEKES